MKIDQPKYWEYIIKLFSRNESAGSNHQNINHEYPDISDPAGERKACGWHCLQALKSIPGSNKVSIYRGVLC